MRIGMQDIFTDVGSAMDKFEFRLSGVRISYASEPVSSLDIEAGMNVTANVHFLKMNAKTTFSMGTDGTTVIAVDFSGEEFTKVSLQSFIRLP